MPKELKGGGILKWDADEKGEALKRQPTTEKPRIIRGYFCGIREIPSAFGPTKTGFVMDLNRGDTQQTWSVPTILYTKLQNVKVGTPLEFHYCGKSQKKSGNEAHEFKVFELSEAEAADMDLESISE